MLVEVLLKFDVYTKDFDGIGIDVIILPKEGDKHE